MWRADVAHARDGVQTEEMHERRAQYQDLAGEWSGGTPRVGERMRRAWRARRDEG